MMFIIFAVLFAFPSFARWATPKEVGSALQQYKMIVEVDPDGSSTTIYEEASRIQTEEGKINASVKEIEYNASTDKVELIDAKTINGKEVVPVQPSAIEDRDKGESRDYDAIKVKSLVYPQVQVGSVLVLKYKLRSSPAPVTGQWSMHFVAPLGMLIEKLQIEVHSAKPLTYSLYDPDGFFRASGSKKRLSFELKKPMPGQVIGEKDSFFHPDRFSTIIVTTEADWTGYFAPLLADFKKILDEKLPAPLDHEIKSWRKIKEPEQQLTKVLEYISQKYRYFGDWRRVRGGLVPRHLSEIEKSRYGDCKDLSTILTAILRQLGYKADVALIERGINPWLNKPQDSLANVGAFNHAIARAESNGRVWWLDPTNSVVALEPYADIASRPVWVLADRTKTFERTPPIATAHYLYDDVETYSFLPSGDVKVAVQADYRSMGAFRLAYGLLTSPREKMLFDVVEYFSDGQDLTDFKFYQASPSPDTNRMLRDLHFDFIYDTPSATYGSPVGQFFPLKDGGLTGAFYETNGRESDLQLSETPLIHHSKKILKNVQGLGEPTVCELQSPWMDLKRQVVYTKTDIEISQEAVVRIPVIEKKDYGSKAFAQLRSQAKKCFYRTGLIFKTL